MRSIMLLLALASRALAGDREYTRSTRGDYGEAEAACADLGMTLAVVTSMAENAAAVAACEYDACWLGLTEVGGDEGTDASDQVWQWADGATITGGDGYENWGDGQPENFGEDERYAGLYYSDDWHDVPYHWEAYALCSGLSPTAAPRAERERFDAMSSTRVEESNRFGRK